MRSYGRILVVHVQFEFVTCLTAEPEATMDLSERPSGPFIRHPWERARQRLLVRVLRTNGLLSNSQTVLDVGSGDAWLAGNLMKLLPPDSTCTCWDKAYTEDSQKNGLLLIKDRPAENFSLLLMLDVLEHLENDRAFFEETICSNLQGGGHALISVPAFSRLFSQYDIRLGHYRRYDKDRLCKLIADAGSGWQAKARTVPMSLPGAAAGLPLAFFPGCCTAMLLSAPVFQTMASRYPD
jgi:hypothetical protein